MGSDKPGNLVALKLERDRAIERLNAAFATDVIDVDEFDRRMELAQAATDARALQQLVADLEGVEALQARESAPTSAADSVALARASNTALATTGDAERVVSVLGDTQRRGAWKVPRKLRVLSVLGNASIDLRDAQLEPGEHVIRVRSILGNVEVIVPPGLSVTCEGGAFLGNFEHLVTPPNDGGPHVRITGHAVLGNVEIVERLPGESETDAVRRHKHERKLRRHKQRAQLPPARDTDDPDLD